MAQKENAASPVKRLWNNISKLWKKETNVYFISGMCYNCSVFDKLRLPKGYKKQYLEWHIPRPDESLREYAKTMAKYIDTKRPFILVGYSFGAVIMQEMSYFLSPKKSIIIPHSKRKKRYLCCFVQYVVLI